MRLSACPFHRQHAHTHARMHARTRACTHARTHTRKPIPPRSLARPCTCVPVRARLRPLRASASRAGGGEGGGWHEAHAFASVCASVRAHELVRVSLRARLVPCTALPHSTARRRGHKRCLKLLSRVRGTARFAFCLRPSTWPSSATCSGTLHPCSFLLHFCSAIRVARRVATAMQSHPASTVALEIRVPSFLLRVCRARLGFRPTGVPFLTFSIAW
jgi:hypothetical protein